jgi:hypothetical protein
MIINSIVKENIVTNRIAVNFPNLHYSFISFAVLQPAEPLCAASITVHHVSCVAVWLCARIAIGCVPG